MRRDLTSPASIVRHALALCALLAAAAGCGESATTAAGTTDAASADDAAGDAAVATDTAADTNIGDAAAVDAAVDVAPDPCTKACVPADACEPAAGAPSCAERCATIGETATLGCLTRSGDCTSLLACLGMVPPKEVLRPFDLVGPYGTGPRDLAGDFEISTTKGPIRYSDLWTGRDSVVLLMTAVDGGGKPYAYPGTLWATPIAKMLAESPKHVHYIFAAYQQSAIPQVQAMQAKVEAAIAALPADKAAHWTQRFHFANEPLPPPNAPVDNPKLGWLAKWSQAQGAWLLGIDPFQRVRSFGLLYLFPVEPQGSYLHSVAIEAQGWAFELERSLGRWTGEEKIVDLAVEKTSKGAFTAQVELPDPSVFAGYDHLEFEMVNDCEQHRVDHCGEWDYLEHVHLCEKPTVAENPYASLPCEGTETKACTCARVDGGTSERVHTCNKEGTGYGACGCACDIELGRWITTYSREGSWWTDLTPQMAHFKQGGTWPIRWSAPGQPKKCDPQDKTKCWETPYVVTARMRLQKRGHGMRPVAAIKVPWPGGAFVEGYNDKQPAFTFDRPAGTKKVELAAFITGHGFGADVANCAEFCNHTHHVRLNGGAIHEKKHPEAGSSLGCKNQISSGVVPNQLGTWPLGRGGWCPGLDVPLWRVDLTADAKDSGNILTYEGLFGGKPYTPTKKDGGSSFWGRIDLSAWVVFYQ